jgi:hypothetical protein
LKLDFKDLVFQLERLGKEYDKRVGLGCWVHSQQSKGCFGLKRAAYWAAQTLILNYIGLIPNGADVIFEFKALETKLQRPCLSVKAVR